MRDEEGRSQSQGQAHPAGIPFPQLASPDQAFGGVFGIRGSRYEDQTCGGHYDCRDDQADDCQRYVTDGSRVGEWKGNGAVAEVEGSVVGGDDAEDGADGGDETAMSASAALSQRQMALPLAAGIEIVGCKLTL